MDGLQKRLSEIIASSKNFLVQKRVNGSICIATLLGRTPTALASFASLREMAGKNDKKYVLGSRFPTARAKDLSSEWIKIPRCFVWEIEDYCEFAVNEDPQIKDKYQNRANRLKLTASKSIVGNAVEAIGNKLKGETLEKIVVSQVFSQSAVIDSFPIHSLVNTLNRIEGGYPFIFSFGDAEPKLFFGSSPEHLAIYDQMNLTVPSIAGTVVLENSENCTEEILFSDPKLIREQKFVTDFIQAKLSEHSDSVEVSPLSIAKNGKLRHLCSSVYARNIRFDAAIACLDSLHPTPAMAGIPQGKAVEFLEENEPYDRGLYASPLGIIDFKKEQFELLIGIRSALLSDSNAYFFAGAGVIAESDIESEELEIRRKISILQERLGQ